MTDENILKIYNCYSQFLSNDEITKAFIWKKLRFADKNYWHSRLYKQKLWDGYNNFFSKETGKFLTGLLPEVQFVLSKLNIKYTIQDNREQIQWRIKEINDQFMNFWLTDYNNNVPKDEIKKDFTMRDFQPELVNGVLKNNRAIVQSPTGSGKTLIMVALVKCLPPNCPTIILCNKKQLCDQNWQELKNWGVENVGRLYDKIKEPNMITCSTWQSAKHIEKLLPKIKVLIVDEVHEMTSKGPRKIYNKLSNCVVRVGLSGTPFKFGETDKTQKYMVKGYFGPRLKVQSAGETGILTTKMLQDKDQLSKSRCIFYPIRTPMLPFATWQDAVDQGIVQNWEFHKIVTRLAKTLKGRSMILVERIDHGDYLENLIPGSLWVHGKDDMDTRRHVLEQLKKAKGNVVAIATQGIFNTGINVFLMNLLNCAGGKADHQIIQRMGRGLRPADDKEILNYYDFYFYINDYLEDHSKKRIKILKKENHEVIIKDTIDF
jgi:superfamily II DNA or RNA helicase